MQIKSGIIEKDSFVYLLFHKKAGINIAYWIQETGTYHNYTNYRKFMCDYLSDIRKLPRVGIEGEKQKNDTVSSSPCAHGSECICLENSTTWILSKDTNTWTQYSASTGNSGSGGGTVIEKPQRITKDDIDSLFNS